MPKPSILFAVALVTGAALTAMNACSSPDTATPSCVFNVGGNGIVPTPNGCEGFAPCLDKNGAKQDSIRCCTDAMGVTLTGDALTSCLYLYGTGSPPGSTTSSSSSSGGTGGGGTGGGGTGDAGADGG